MPTTKIIRGIITLGSLLALGACEGMESLDDPSLAAGSEGIEAESAALTTGNICAVIPGDGVSCPEGFAPVLNGRIFTCEKKVQKDPNCPIGLALSVRDGKDTCKVLVCLPFTDCSNKTPTCESGWTYSNDGGAGNRDACKKTEFKYANGCFANENTARFGVTCPSDAERVERVDGKFRCIDSNVPSCFPGYALVTQAGADVCQIVTPLGPTRTAPFCGLLPPPAGYQLLPDQVGNADRCVAHGWPLPVPVLAP